MKACILFFARRAAQTLRTLALFAAVILAGMLVFRSSSGLFAVYGRLLPISGVLLCCYGGGLTSVALCFGATRRHCFWAYQCCVLPAALVFTAVTWAFTQLELLLQPALLPQMGALLSKPEFYLFLLCATLPVQELVFLYPLVEHPVGRGLLVLLHIAFIALITIFLIFSLYERLEALLPGPVWPMLSLFCLLLALVLAGLNWAALRKAVSA